MCRILLVVALLGFAAPAAPVPDDKPQPPKGSAPAFATVAGLDADKGVLRTQSIVYVNVTKQVPETVVIGNRTVTRNKAVTEQVPQTRTTEYKLDQFDITTGDGKTLSLDAATPLFQATAVVLIVDGPLDPAYRRLLRGDALILVRKKASGAP